jgi:hypothetical protein
MPSSNPVKYAAAGVAAVVLAFGAYSLGSSKSNHGSAGSANAAVPNGQMPANGRLPRNGQGPPGFGTPATGAAADNAKAAALAKYQGTAERVMKLQDGSYLVHVITANGEVHVVVSKDFKVTGAQQGGPGGAGAAPAPSGTSQ